ncbi:UDP-N-acetylmuramate dehydrogenase [Thalassotalea sp. M1531]|uniref:UDP-N-acetylenolpyruvoylglucosamine reductase n=1 Tax=Thalassotalea algicola TaxID=2716224 RepID=A0A7Y0Q8C7_9GAMM|nr:UDP-N-acetylmuramate dehydrogenase [Thalassotalea algicola]NMP33333.1 UDP-N-acetylmuramate dehydrogenase [Thalassotalea algicola]
MPSNPQSPINTLAISALSPEIVTIKTIEDLQKLNLITNSEYYVLGEGSNVLFTEPKTPKILRPLIKGIEIEEAENCFLLNVGAGENWHELVKFTIERDMPGLENLALIPGSVGAAPVQNIGAYGVEFSDFCCSVNWYNFGKKKIETFNKHACLYGYRNSVFKGNLKGKGIIVSVKIVIPKKWTAKLNYAGLNTLHKNVTPSEVMAKVIEIRESKLPNPNELANAGSFFKNPVVAHEQFTQLIAKFPNIPNYPQANETVKLAAGWLIEQAGFKGFKIGDAGVHKDQALVLVNYGSASGRDMIKLAKLIIEKITEKFGINLEPEVRLVDQSGECTIEELIENV